MRNLIEPHMAEALERHVLELQGTWTGSRGTVCEHWLMHRPGTGIYALHLMQVSGRIILTGDLTFGGRNGIISMSGYDLKWFAGATDQAYLCSKFLPEVFNRDRAADEIREWVKEEEDGRKREQLMEVVDELEAGDIGQEMMYQYLSDISWEYVQDGVPGYGYDPIDAGWLCMVQQKFRELWKPA